MANETTALAKNDIVGNLQAVTKKSVEELRLATVALLPKEVRGSFESLAAFVMRCQSIGVDAFGAGVYAIVMRGDLKILLHYSTYVGMAVQRGLIGREDWYAETVYQGEKFSYTEREVKHERIPEKRSGIPMGAYAVGRPKGSHKPLVIYVSYKDFAKNADSPSSAWKSSAYEMMCKAATKVLFKRLFADVYAGIYMDGEFDGAPQGPTMTTEQAADGIFDAVVDEAQAAPEATEKPKKETLL